MKRTGISMQAVKKTVLLTMAFATFFNNALHWYTQITTYPLFRRIGQEAFPAYHKAYERRLPLSIYTPYTLLMGSTLLFAFLRPAQVRLRWVLALLGLNGAIMAESLIFAKPIHDEFDHEEHSTEQGIQGLVNYNGLRLITATISSCIVLYLLTQVFSLASTHRDA